MTTLFRTVGTLLVSAGLAGLVLSLPLGGASMAPNGEHATSSSASGKGTHDRPDLAPVSEPVALESAEAASDDLDAEEWSETEEESSDADEWFPTEEWSGDTLDGSEIEAWPQEPSDTEEGSEAVRS